jgi:hypothetical protein
MIEIQRGLITIRSGWKTTSSWQTDSQLLQHAAWTRQLYGTSDPICPALPASCSSCRDADLCYQGTETS